MRQIERAQAVAQPLLNLNIGYQHKTPS